MFFCDAILLDSRSHHKRQDGWCIFEVVGAKHLQVEGVDMDDSNVACCCNGGELGWDVGECSL